MEWNSILDLTALIVGLVYLLLEYRASIYVWIAGIIMPAVDLFLYWDAGLYGDFGLAVYYLLASIYGFIAWKFWKKESTTEEMPITRFPLRLLLPVTVVFLVVWGIVWAFLQYWTNSTVPVTDSLTNALSIIGMWMLARKYVEQWIVWIVADAIYVWLYAYKGLPFKASLYTFYIIIAFFGIRAWKQKMNAQKQ
ncbi:MAG: nicotinamide riboside transporter PnuC [Bacteroidales bacterium]|nr:nicotinamide riboside transporter PnuC [Bacteroidales bacterium]